MENMIDTIMNILVFVFIGLMIWLYSKDVPESEEPEKDGTSDTQ